MKQFSIFFRFVRHLLRSGSRKGHGIHSPYLFSFVSEVLGNAEFLDVPEKLQKLHRAASRDRSFIDTGDIGAGSRKMKSPYRQVSGIVRNSSVSPKWGALLFRMVKWYRPERVVELGTGIGISTAYLASGGKMPVISVEASGEKCRYAQSLLEKLDCSHVQLIPGTFDHELPRILKKTEDRTLFYIDGNHTFEATVRYGKQILALGLDDALIIFDDINWSDGMYAAWSSLKKDPGVTVSVDLFFMGVLIIRDQLQKGSFSFVF